MEMLPTNAAELLQHPAKAALRLVHAQLESSQEQGLAIYFHKDDPNVRRPDFLIGLADRAYFALHVIDQPHGVEQGKLMLVRAGGSPVKSQAGFVAVHAVAISNAVNDHLNHRIFVMPVLLLAREQPAAAVQDWAIKHNVHMLGETGLLVDRLVRIARENAGQIYSPPPMAEIMEVMDFFNAEGIIQAATAAAEPDETPDLGLTARQVIIQHADTVNVYTTSYTTGA